MKHGFLLLAAAVLALATGLRAADQPVGMLTSVYGKVQVMRQGEQHAAQAAEFLFAGDHVTSGAASFADFLYCPELRAARIAAASEVSFEAGTLRVVRGSLLREWAIPACRLPAVTALSIPSQQHLGITRLRSLLTGKRPTVSRQELMKQYDELLGDRDMVLFWPANTSVATLRPSFRWTPVEGAVSYEFRLMGREENVLWSTTLARPELAYPATSAGATRAVRRPAAKPGSTVPAYALAWGQRYWWRVVARDRDEEDIAEAGSYFDILPEEQARSFDQSAVPLRRALITRPGDSGRMLALAFLYEENGLLDQAALIYGRLKSPEWTQARLAELAVKLGWSPATPPDAGQAP